MGDPVTQDAINDAAWRACDSFRGALDSDRYREYILVLLFLKYVSDLRREPRQNRARRLVLPAEADFYRLHSRRHDAGLGERINLALKKLEDANRDKLDGVFRGADFSSESHLGRAGERQRRLAHLLEDFAHPRLDLRPSRIGDNDIIGNTYEYLIGRFAADAGKKGGEFYTPPEVARLLARLLAPRPGERVCDPACGSGSLLIRVAREVRGGAVSLFGQESNGSTWALCRMNLFLHQMDDARIEWCNTLTDPRLSEHDRLLQFDVVVANPPFSLDKWGAESAGRDRFGRFHRGVPPRSRGDFAFITHMIETCATPAGRTGVVVPHGVLFRGGTEGRIRATLVREGLLSAVIGLPAGLFFGTGIPAAILIFERARTTRDVLFVDASDGFEEHKRRNRLREDALERIVAAYRAFETIEGFTHRASPAEVAENEFNLSIPRYVDRVEEEEAIDLHATRAAIEEIERELESTRREMDGYLEELGLWTREST